MAHQSLYRKYRPQTFGDVVGQEHITRTLRNAVDDGAVAHAYLFAGPRGTGKTTTARILAKALDCEKGPTPDPDDTCQACREIAEGRHPDVYELDAASRTGVDAVRDEIITKVNYAATRGGYKVYIIDEVHMLSTSAFNALLKTLEEPPGRTVFVLCTTHPQKVPDTILSRCQRFDFRRIGNDDIVSRLAFIAQKEGIAVEEGTLPLIARHAAGGMRNAIGTLDQLAAFTGKRVTLVDVEGLLGEVDSAALARVTRLIADRDAAGCFRFVETLAESGTDMAEFVRNLTSHFRDLYVISAGGDDEGVVEATSAERESMRDEASLFDLDRLGRMLEVLGALSSEMRWTPDPRLALEVALTRMARPVSDLTLSSIAERVAALEAGLSAAAPVTSRAPEAPRARSDAASPPARKSETPAPPSSSPEPAPRRSSASAGLDTAAVRREWPDVLRAVKAARPALAQALSDTEVDVDGDVIVVEFAPNRRTPMHAASQPEATALLRQCVEKVLGRHVALRYQVGRGVVRRVPGSDSSPATETSPEEPAATDDTPAAEQGHEMLSGPSDAERLLIDELGAEVISDDNAGN